MSPSPKPLIAIFHNPYHDRIGRKTTITDGQGTRTFAYSPALLLTNETIVAGSQTNSITFTFDTYGRRSGITVNGDNSVDYGYSSVGRFASITSIVLNATNAWQYQYLANSDLIAKLVEAGSGVTNSRSYEANRNLITEIHNIAKGVTVSKYEYQNDALGRRTQRIDTLATVVTNDFGYNDRSELTNTVMSGKVYGYDYDSIGNRETHATNGTSYSYAANQLNQYTNIHNGVTNSLAYDSDGNLLTDGTSTNTWNGENRLVAVQPLSPSLGDSKAEFSYDHQGRRFRKVVWSHDGTNWINAATNTFVYSGWNLVCDDNGSDKDCYVWGMDLSGSLQGAGGVGGLLSWTRSSDTNTCLYSFDANGNVSDLLDAADSTNIVASYQFDAYGNLVSSSGADASNNVFRFSSKYWDDETGLSYYGFRYYDAGLGRWPSRRPIPERGSHNLYLFSANNQVSYFDPDGRAPTIANNSSGDTGDGNSGGDTGDGNSGGNGSQPFNYCQCLKVEHSRLYYEDSMGSFWASTYSYESVLPPNTKPKEKSWCNKAEWVQIKVVPKYGGQNALVGNNGSQPQAGQNPGNQDPVATECRNLIRRQIRTNFGWRNDYRYHPIVAFTTPAGNSRESLWVTVPANMTGNWRYQTRASKNVLWAPGNITVKIKCSSPSGTVNCNLPRGTGTLAIN